MTNELTRAIARRISALEWLSRLMLASVVAIIVYGFWISNKSSETTQTDVSEIKRSAEETKRSAEQARRETELESQKLRLFGALNRLSDGIDRIEIKLEKDFEEILQDQSLGVRVRVPIFDKSENLNEDRVLLKININLPENCRTLVSFAMKQSVDKYVFTDQYNDVLKLSSFINDRLYFVIEDFDKKIRILEKENAS
jgi:hypothetical protein